jgi:hypothetical protein
LKLLFDENLSLRLLETLQADFPDSTHIERLKMRGATDAAIWAYARSRLYDRIQGQRLPAVRVSLWAAAEGSLAGYR